MLSRGRGRSEQKIRLFFSQDSRTRIFSSTRTQQQIYHPGIYRNAFTAHHGVSRVKMQHHFLTCSRRSELQPENVWSDEIEEQSSDGETQLQSLEIPDQRLAQHRVKRAFENLKAGKAASVVECRQHRWWVSRWL